MISDTDILERGTDLETEPPFYANLEAHGGRLAVRCDDGQSLTYSALAALSESLSPPDTSDGRKGLGFVFCESSPMHLAVYLGALRHGHAAALLNVGLNAELEERLVRVFRPDWIVLPSGYQSARLEDDYRCAEAPHDVVRYVRRNPSDRPAPHQDLALLLSTSGSTGSVKLVRLSAQNLSANATSIRQYMGLTSQDRALASLPMHYSFGLSVVNSHLDAGAALLFSEGGFLSPDFWQFASDNEASVLAGVPFHFESWRRLGLDTLALPKLRILAQAGGRLSDALQQELLTFAQNKNAEFFVMYGQTEAAPRISFVPPDMLARKIGTIGQAIPGGRLSLDPVTSEIIYEGPNVMLGYAESAADLARGDDQQGVLRTGDVGSVDDDGIFRIVGRLKRFIKLYGERIGLDELEHDLRERLAVSLACAGSDNRLIVAVEDADAVDPVKQCLRDTFRMRMTGVQVHHVATLPRLDSGKLDYTGLLRDLADA